MWLVSYLVVLVMIVQCKEAVQMVVDWSRRTPADPSETRVKTCPPARLRSHQPLNLSRPHPRHQVVLLGSSCPAWVQDVGDGGRSTLDGKPSRQAHLSRGWLGLDTTHLSLAVCTSSPINSAVPNSASVVLRLRNAKRYFGARARDLMYTIVLSQRPCLRRFGHKER